MRPLVGLLVLVLLLAACDGAADEAASPTGATTGPETPAAASPPAVAPTDEPTSAAVDDATDETAIDVEPTAGPGSGDDEVVGPVDTFGTGPVTAGDFPSGGGEIALLTDVRVGSHEGMDRVVIELDGDEMPSYRVAYVDSPVRADGSGREVAVEGAAFLELRLSPAAGVDLRGEHPVEKYTGPDRVPGDTTAMVAEVVEVGDFEASLAWVVGLRQEMPFAVAALDDPLRLVVDVDVP